MAYPDLSDLLLRLRSLLDEQSTRLYSDAQLTRWLNEGEFDLAAKSLCMEDITTVTTTADTRAVSLYCAKILAVVYVGSDVVGVTKIVPRYLGHLTLSGLTPQYWFQWGYQLGIEPIPNDSYSLNVYVAKLPDVKMSDTTDEPEVPKEFQHLVVRYAFYKALMRDRLFGQAGTVYQQYINDMTKIRMDVLNKYAAVRRDLTLPDYIEVNR